MTNYVGQFYRACQCGRRPAVAALSKVLPVVIYSGKSAWSALQEVHELIDRTLPVSKACATPLHVGLVTDCGTSRAAADAADRGPHSHGSNRVMMNSHPLNRVSVEGGASLMAS